MAIHLENGQRVYFNKNTLAQQISDPKKTTLMGFFDLCVKDKFASTLLYVEVPQYFLWNNTTRCWDIRKEGIPVEDYSGYVKSTAIGRIYTVHISNFECFCLRMLLNVRRGPTSFEDLKHYNGMNYNSYHEVKNDF